MTLAFDEPPARQQLDCGSCARRYTVVKALVRRDGDAYAVAHASLHVHGSPETWINVALGSFSEERDDDRVTFGCVVGVFEGRDEPSAGLVRAAQEYGDTPLWGRKLTRDEALAHPRLPEFWEVVDFLLVHEPAVHQHVYG